MSEFSTLIKKYRIRNGLTQKNIADLLGVSINTIHLWEVKGRIPSVTTLSALAELMDMDVKDLIIMTKKYQK